VNINPTHREAGRLRLIGAASLLAVVLAGCSSPSTDQPNGTATELISQLPAASGEVESFVWNLTNGEPTSIDPPNAPTLSGAAVASNLCEPLLAHDAEYQPVDGLAEYEVVSPTEIVYTVRTDATFWDGSQVTAEDVAYSLQRAAKPEALVSFVYSNVASIEVTGEQDVTVTFSQPDELFNAEMTTFAGGIVQKAFAEEAGADFGTPAGGLMCSGPYTYTEWVPGDHITVTRNDSYWNTDSAGLAESIKFTFVSDSAAYTQALIAGEIDGTNEITASAIPALQASESGKLYFGPSMQSMNMYVARADGPLADLDVRTAFQTLVDRESVADVIYAGAATPMYTALAPTTWQTEAKDTYAEAYEEFEDARAYDLDASKELIEGSSYDGETIVLAVPAGDETVSRIAQLVQESAKDAGLTTKIESLQPLDYATAFYDPTKREGIDLIVGSSFNGVQDPMEQTGFLYLPGSFSNYIGYDNAEVTALIKQSLGSFEAEERADLFVQIQSIVEKESAVIPIVSTNTVTYLNDRLTGAVTSFAYLTMPALAAVGASE
jgi:peptide/nickel transport system substrate-binding protein